MAYTQQNRLVSLETPLGADVLLLRKVIGTEAISRLFRFDLELFSEKSSISFKDIIGQNVTFRVALPGDKERFFNGFVSRFSQSGADVRFTHYQMEVVPWLWFLTRNADCRIFQNMSIPEILQKVFKDHGFSNFKSSLTGTYDPREYCVQYRETDFNFVSRLMEQHGIFYFFEHENGKHTLVMADSPSVHQACPDQGKAHFNASTGVLDTEDVISGFQVEQELRTGKYSLTDYNFETPSTSLLAGEPTVVNVGPNSAYEIYDYPGLYLNQSQAGTLSKVHMQEEEAKHKVATGTGACRGFMPGYTFDLEEHYREDLNTTYILTQVTHEASVGESFEFKGEGPGSHYSNHFSCIPLATPFRPARMTPKPFVQGPQTAVVVGKSGEEIWTDKYGRVKVQFYWDRQGKKDDNSSCWIRVSQPWAGKNWGAMWIPRISQEVIVSFLEGDPDRPIITGRVYNADSMPPYTLPDEQTKSTFKSNSSKGGEGFNELRFEDKKGEEQVFIHAEKNLDVRVKNNEYETVCKDLHLMVEQDRFEHVKNDHHETIDRDYAQSIGRDHHLKVSGKEAIAVDDSLSLKVGGDVTEQFGANHSEEVSQAIYLKAGMTIVIEAPMGITLKCGGNSVVVDPVGVTLTSSALITVMGTLVNINSGPGSPAGVGIPGALIPPMSPKAADEADKADPGEMAEIKADQIKKQQGKYGSTALSPFKPNKSSGDGGGGDDGDGGGGGGGAGSSGGSGSGGGSGSSAANSSQSGSSDSKKPHWIEIKLVDTDSNPVPGEKYKITLPDGSTVAEGTLDGKGFARVDGIDPGTCKVTFPNLDESAWKPK